MLTRIIRNQRRLAREVLALPGRSKPDKLFLLARLYLHRGLRVIRRRYIYARSRSFGSRLEKLIRNDRLEVVPCPLCRTPAPGNGIRVFGGLWLRRCGCCGLGYISPRLSGEALRKLYGRKYYFEYRAWRGIPITGEDETEGIVLSHRRLPRAEQWIPPGRLLDIGCSTGQLLRAARERGYEPSGVELDAWTVKHARKKHNLDVRSGPLRASTFPGQSFDLITLIDVLEHMPDPVEQMSMAADLLCPAGIILAVVPNSGCEEAQKDISAWKHFKPWEHICFYDSRTLRELGRRSGLELIDVDTELSSGAGYVGALMAFFRRADYDIPPDARKISIRVDGARGDTLLATPVLRGLRRRFPQAELRVETGYPELLEAGENISTVPAKAPAEGDAQVRASYEIDPAGHVVEVMMRYCRAGPSDRHIYYIVRPEEKQRARELLEREGVKSPAVGIHPLSGSRIKRWRQGNWALLGELLRDRGFDLVLLGGKEDTTGIIGAGDFRGRLSERESIAILAEMDAFVGLDSFLAHAAGAVRTPRVLLFGSTDPERILCDLDTCPTVVLQGDCPYLGCRQDCLPDQWIRNVECRRGDPVCLDAISPEKVSAAVWDLVNRRG